MGPAPPAGERPAMPGPVQLVRRSVSHAVRQGYSYEGARRRVIAAITTLSAHAYEWDLDLTWWLDELVNAAKQLPQGPKSPTTHRQESDHGDRSTRGGRRAGAS